MSINNLNPVIYSPNTGDTAVIIFVALGVIAIAALIFISRRRKK
jgi:LPXTG-motif cell wall-anchored protein